MMDDGYGNGYGPWLWLWAAMVMVMDLWCVSPKQTPILHLVIPKSRHLASNLHSKLIVTLSKYTISHLGYM